MNIKPIKTEENYQQALERIETLWGAEQDTPEGDELDILITLVSAYEDKHYPISPPDPIEAIKYEMECKGLTRKDLQPILGERGRVSEILNGKRQLTLGMIRKLHKQLKIPLESLVRV